MTHYSDRPGLDRSREVGNASGADVALPRGGVGGGLYIGSQ